MGEPVTDLSCDGDTEEAMEVGLEIAKAMALHCSLWNAWSSSYYGLRLEQLNSMFRLHLWINRWEPSVPNGKYTCRFILYFNDISIKKTPWI